MWLGIKYVIRANHMISLMISSTTDPGWLFLNIKSCSHGGSA